MRRGIRIPAAVLWLVLALFVIGVGTLLTREMPGMKRYLKSERM